MEGRMRVSVTLKGNEGKRLSFFQMRVLKKGTKEGDVGLHRL